MADSQKPSGAQPFEQPGFVQSGEPPSVLASASFPGPKHSKTFFFLGEL